MGKNEEVIIKDTHWGLKYVDGILSEKALEAGPQKNNSPLWRLFYRRPKQEIILIERRERELTIRDKEIITKDKVVLRVSILVRFKVICPYKAISQVFSYEECLCSDVYLLARRILAAMPLEEILTKKDQPNKDILSEINSCPFKNDNTTEYATQYGVKLVKADVKDIDVLRPESWAQKRSV